MRDVKPLLFRPGTAAIGQDAARQYFAANPPGGRSGPPMLLVLALAAYLVWG